MLAFECLTQLLQVSRFDIGCRVRLSHTEQVVLLRNRFPQFYFQMTFQSLTFRTKFFIILRFQASDEFIFYDVSVDWDGLTVRVEEPSK